MPARVAPRSMSCSPQARPRPGPGVGRAPERATGHAGRAGGQMTEFLDRDRYQRDQQADPAIATATPSCTARPPARWCWSGPRYAAPPSRLLKAHDDSSVRPRIPGGVLSSTARQEGEGPWGKLPTSRCTWSGCGESTSARRHRVVYPGPSPTSPERRAQEIRSFGTTGSRDSVTVRRFMAIFIPRSDPRGPVSTLWESLPLLVRDYVTQVDLGEEGRRRRHG